jgi:ubiquinone/menaquinone biosynthesis C-methylase UbiE
MPNTIEQRSVRHPPSGENTIPVEAWNTILFEKFCRFRFVLTQGLSDHSTELLRRRPYPAGARVLDVGCGFDTAQLIARQVRPGGAAVGVDCASNFVETARRETAEAGVEGTSFFVADVQTEDLRGPYDAAFSRFGTMFFNLPGLALRNIRRALRPGAELAMIVWRRREDNPCARGVSRRHRPGSLWARAILHGRRRYGQRHAPGCRL